jgi:hypothetical protein
VHSLGHQGFEHPADPGADRRGACTPPLVISRNRSRSCGIEIKLSICHIDDPSSDGSVSDFGVFSSCRIGVRIVRRRRALPLSLLTMSPPSGRVGACRRQGVNVA